MRCETCGCEIADTTTAAVSLENAARMPDLLEALGDDYFASFGIPVSRAGMRQVAETVGGSVTLCPDCQLRLDTPVAGAASLVPPTYERPAADLAAGAAPAPVGWCLVNLTSTDPSQRALAVRSLVRMGAEGVSALLAWLPTCTADRSAGIEALGYLQAEEAAPALVGVILTGDPGEHGAVWHALAALGNKSLPAFAEALAPEAPTTPEERRELLQALARLGDDGVPLICESLTDPEPAVRRAAFDALELAPSEACLGPVSDQLADHDRRVRKSAVSLIGRKASPQAAPILMDMLTDPSTEVRTAAAWALVRLAEPIPWPAEEDAPEWKADGWLYGGLLQLAGRDREETAALLAQKGVPVNFDREPTRTAAEVMAEAKELVSGGQLEAAEQFLAEAAPELPFDVGPTALLAQCLAQLKRWDEAGETLERVIALDPFNARWHHNLAVAKWQAGARALAAGQWQQAVLLDPSHAGAQEALSRVKADEVGPIPVVCVAHSSLQASGRCAVCGVPLCRTCTYQGSQGTYCERHLPPVPDENRQHAHRLVTAARADIERLRRRLADTRRAFVTLGVVLSDVALYSVLGATVFDPPGPGGESPVAAVRALRDALLYDPSRESAAILLDELGDLCDGAGYPGIVPADLRQWAWELCAHSNPRALLARFVLHSATDRAAALRAYFQQWACQTPPRWDAKTVRVIETAADAGLGPDLLPYLRASRARLRPHSPEQRECRVRLRALET